MNTRYAMTLCTTMIVGGAWMAASAQALGSDQTPATGESVRMTQENAFFDRHIDKAVKLAREAEQAGNQGHASEMREQAQQSLTQAQHARRAGNVPGLDEGILSLREALSQPLAETRAESGNHRSASAGMAPCVDHKGEAAASTDCEPHNPRMGDGRSGGDTTAYELPSGILAACASGRAANGTVLYDDQACQPEAGASQAVSLQHATAHIRNARIIFSKAGGIRTSDQQTQGLRTRMVSGQLVGDEASSRKDGGAHYFLRDRSGQDLPITLTGDMSRHVRVGDKVKAQLDADGRVLSIAKDHGLNP
jgi:hypothetical protein